MNLSDSNNSEATENISMSENELNFQCGEPDFNRPPSSVTIISARTALPGQFPW